MIDDINYEAVPFVLEYITPLTGTIAAYSLNGSDYDYTNVTIITGSTSGYSESSYVFVS